MIRYIFGVLVVLVAFLPQATLAQPTAFRSEKVKVTVAPGKTVSTKSLKIFGSTQNVYPRVMLGKEELETDSFTKHSATYELDRVVVQLKSLPSKGPIIIKVTNKRLEVVKIIIILQWEIFK